MRRVLLVADDAPFREGLALLLEWRAGLGNVQAASLEDADRVLSERPAAIGAAIVDADLPGGDGIELIGRLRGADPCVPVVALTAARHPDRRARALRAGAQEVFGVREPGAVEGIVGAAGRLAGDAQRFRGVRLPKG